MAQVPRFTRRIAPTFVDPTAVQDAGSGARAAASAFGQAADVAFKFQEAKDASFVAERSTTFERDVDTFFREFQLEASSDPVGKKKDFDSFVNKRYEELSKDASPKALQAMGTIKGDVEFKYNTAYGEFARTQSIKNFTNSYDETIRNVSTLAFRAGKDGQDVNSVSELMNSVDMADVAGSTFISNDDLGRLSAESHEAVMSNYLSGVMDSDPAQALTLLEDEKVQEAFTNMDQLDSIKDAAKSRALNFTKISTENEIIGIMKGENAIMGQINEKPMSYASLHSQLDDVNASPLARSAIMKASGYGDKKKLTRAKQVESKSEIYRKIVELSNNEGATSKDVSAVQNLIYKGLDDGSLTKKDANLYFNAVLTPAIDKRQEELEDFSSGGFLFNAFGDRVGFGNLQSILKEVNIKDDGDGLEDDAVAFNKQNTVALYDLFNENLVAETTALKISPSDIDGLAKSDRRALLSKVENKTRRDFFTSMFPELSTLEKLPASIVTNDGRRINTGVAGTGNTVDAKPPVSFDNVEDMDAANLPIGTRVIVNGVSGTVSR